jgi:hypothetical protein
MSFLSQFFAPSSIAAFEAWRRQPTTVAGFSVVTGTLSALASHQLTLPAAVPALIGGLVGMILPDHTAAAASGAPK